MTIDEAIKELEEPDWMITEYQIPVYMEAVRLGIEALKRVKLIRGNQFYPHLKRLYGETEE